MGIKYVVCRVAYAAMDVDSPAADRTVKDFPAETHAQAEKDARRWATSRNDQRSDEDRLEWPWVLERWDVTSRSWEFLAQLN
ncbi:hypothetical protein SAMN04489844_0472 [Nocardioides exalbidus]|uniref:Uncharacterized protein n=1 Tax=Nocardioides exalbidus TaxID=402596 RepID=A0A1H4K8Y0_9ACTN|nr:hypothetical protein [Nocardioides exalbidus]SEB54498.1 hypothetical protein SAMN04489844_0472 [Nocardioides exalbidus]